MGNLSGRARLAVLTVAMLVVLGSSAVRILDVPTGTEVAARVAIAIQIGDELEGGEDRELVAFALVVEDPEIEDAHEETEVDEVTGDAREQRAHGRWQDASSGCRRRPGP